MWTEGIGNLGSFQGPGTPSGIEFGTSRNVTQYLNQLHRSPHPTKYSGKSRRMRWAGNVARVGERSGACRVLVGKAEGKRPPGKPRHRLENNIKVCLQPERPGGSWTRLVWFTTGTGNGHL
jgi:hypothetical protein